MSLETAEELAKRYDGKFTKRTILKWAKKGWIPSTRVNARVILFDPVVVKRKLSKSQ